MKLNVILDIDGCILEPSGRIHHFLAGDHDAYHRDWHTDVVKPQGVAIYENFIFDPKYQCVFITGRHEKAKDYTMHQLESLFGAGFLESTGTKLMMRPADKPELSDVLLKPMLLYRAGISVKDVFLAFDDRQCIVDMWRSLGIVCYQPQPGDF